MGNGHAHTQVGRGCRRKNKSMRIPVIEVVVVIQGRSMQGRSAGEFCCAVRTFLIASCEDIATRLVFDLEVRVDRMASRIYFGIQALPRTLRISVLSARCLAPQKGESKNLQSVSNQKLSEQGEDKC